jgi:hypothetical protein
MANPKTVKIDNKEYPLDSLSDAAKQQLMNLRVVDQEIAHLQRQLAIAQTARTVYANNVKNNLPAPELQS